MIAFTPKTFRSASPVILAVCLVIQAGSPACASSDGSVALSADASIQTSSAALEKKNYSGALSALEPALLQRPSDPVVLNLRGAILTKMNDYSGAQASYEEALKADPDFFPARYNLGALLALRREWDPAISYFRNLLIEQPNNELIQFKLLLLLLRQHADQPLQDRLFSSESPSSTPAWYYAKAARAYQKGNPAEAARYLEVARSVFGDHTGIFQEELDESGLKVSKKDSKK